MPPLSALVFSAFALLVLSPNSAGSTPSKPSLHKAPLLSGLLSKITGRAPPAAESRGCSSPGKPACGGGHVAPVLHVLPHKPKEQEPCSVGRDMEKNPHIHEHAAPVLSGLLGKLKKHLPSTGCQGPHLGGLMLGDSPLAGILSKHKHVPGTVGSHHGDSGCRENAGCALLGLLGKKEKHAEGNSGGEEDYRHELACENADLTLSCPSGKTIKIISANYGRTDKSTCPGGPIQTTTCRHPKSLHVVQQRCDGHQKCTVPSSNSVFGDPCVGTFKYLHVEYECESRETIRKQVCENEEVTLTCPAGHAIYIISANYGRSDQSTCPKGPIKTTSCRQPETLHILKYRCEGKETCSFHASNGVFSDPCVGTYKYLDVNYQCGPWNGGKKEVCENEEVTLSCPAGRVIRVTSANYGRTDHATCPGGPILTTSCSQPNTSKIIQRRCDGKDKCTFHASNGIFGDPCVGTFKYLQVHYDCTTLDERKKRVCEGEHATLSCPAGHVIGIRAANYGRTERAACPGGRVKTTSCYGPNSAAIIKDRCEGRQECTVYASNSWFGDPCEGTVKYLDVNYFCKMTEVGQKRVCENERLSLSCPAGHVITVNSANYGRTDDSTCPGGPIQCTDCTEPNSLQIVRNRCQGEQHCQIHASNAVFGDPCQGTFKFLEVNYSCKQLDSGKKQVCENGNLTISCPAGNEIIILSANYGRLEETTCPGGPIETTSCQEPRTVQIVKHSCERREECTISASNRVFGDPCAGTFKYLDVYYLCKKSDAGKKQVCENERMSLSCPAGQVITVTSANYGRTDDSTCPGGPIECTDCTEPKSLQFVQNRCEGKQQCDIHATNAIFGDPCAGTFKYLTVDYKCKSLDAGKKRVCEGEQLKLSCPAGQLIVVSSANYGRADDFTCPGGPIQTTTCSQQNSLQVVQNRCDYRESCTVEASNTVFGDPCKGTFKYLEVYYFCKKSNAGKKTVCESERMTLSCPADQTICVTSANYGRTDNSTCPGGPVQTTKCSAQTSLEVVQRRCEGKHQCYIQASNAEFGDPCEGTFKYLDVNYKCKTCE